MTTEAIAEPPVAPPHDCGTGGEHTHAYIALYESDSMEARKSCQMVILYGMENDTRCKATKPATEQQWKYLDLFCTHCQFSHGFKRMTWWEGFPLPVPPSYFEESE